MSVRDDCTPYVYFGIKPGAARQPVDQVRKCCRRFDDSIHKGIDDAGAPLRFTEVGTEIIHLPFFHYHD